MLGVETGDGAEHVPFALLARFVELSPLTPNVVDEPEALFRGDEIASLDSGDPRSGDEAHGGEGDGRGGRKSTRADPALKVSLRAASLSGRVEVDVRDEGGGHKGDKDGGHQAAERHGSRCAQGLLGADVRRGDDADEEGADEQRGQLDQGQEGGASGASVVDEYLGRRGWGEVVRATLVSSKGEALGH